MVDLATNAPYADYMKLSVPDGYYYTDFTVNGILDEVDAYISIPKMKQHYMAGVTHSLKNQIGMVPVQFYQASQGSGLRDALHSAGGDYRSHLPRAISDLNLARPVNLAVIDGIKNAVGGEGAWNPTFQTAQFNVLLAGKDPVAADSIASHLMGNDPEAEKLQLPGGDECDNHLELLRLKGAGTNQLSDIETVGDGAGLVGIRPPYEYIRPKDFKLIQNYPNPLNAETTIQFFVPHKEHITIKLYDIHGRQIDVLVNAVLPSGSHSISLNTRHLPSGVYLYRMQAGRFSETRRMIVQK
jgi:hypothetical protein